MRFPGAPMVCHVLLLETESGLVLVDSGFGLQDIADPEHRIGPFRHVIRPVLTSEETALRQVERLGFNPDDVHHILLTHFDIDHIGGLSDFPRAQVHLSAAEAQGAIHHPSFTERQRYHPLQWAYGPAIVEHAPGKEVWRGFSGVKALVDIAPGLLMVPLPGHTRGHCGYAIDTGGRWLLHAGDAFYYLGTLDGRSKVPLLACIQERLLAFDFRQVRNNHARLAALQADAEPDLDIICAHDPALFHKFAPAGQ
ncbi:MBL fold metallo-hydrolase [Acetobacter malorum]|nr:MBL fold metallo-hydrolase [Acetobacter malorum]